jgi:hypothetical protein
LFSEIFVKKSPLKINSLLTSQTLIIPKQEKRQKIDPHVENTHPRDEVQHRMNMIQHINFESMYPKMIIKIKKNDFFYTHICAYKSGLIFLVSKKLHNSGS